MILVSTRFLLACSPTPTTRISERQQSRNTACSSRLTSLVKPGDVQRDLYGGGGRVLSNKVLDRCVFVVVSVFDQTCPLNVQNPNSSSLFEMQLSRKRLQTHQSWAPTS